MAEVFNFYVQDNRSILFPKNNLLEPIMQEDHKVATWRFRIPKVLNQIDMSAWSWWFVYVNAKGQEFSELLTLTDDIDEPDSYSTADYDIDYGISKFPGSFSFALEAISTEQGGEISGEWHTKTYKHKVDSTLQGNQAEYAETESDIISALLEEVRTKVNQLVGGATPLPVALKSLMTDHDKVYLYIGEETGESTGYWYHYNGTQFVPGGLYGAGDPEAVQGYVEDWLDDHPEATTTVQDGAVTTAKLASGSVTETKLASGSVSSDKVQGGAITEAKLAEALKIKTIKDYVTPEMFGAVGDGVADDTQAIQNAIDSGKSVKLSTKTYLIYSPLYVDWFTTILGDSAGWNSGGTVIKASNDFSGDYMLIISHNNNDYCRSVNICDINLNCNFITGGINAIHLYDASILKNINITQIGVNDYGINIKYKGRVTQTLTCINVLCAADPAAQRDGTKAIIHLERLQECTLINVKAFANNSNAFDIFGCETLTMISCATYDYSNTYKAFNFGIYAKEGFTPHYIRNITMIGCLNEGNPMGLYIDGKYQTLTGTFTEYTTGALVTQNNTSGVIASGSASSIIVYPISGEFVTGTCSSGEITAINNEYSDGFEIDYQPKLHGVFSSVTVKGVSNSAIKVNKTIGYTTGIDYTVENNYCTKIVVAPDDVHSMNTDYTSEISLQSPVVLFASANGSNISGFPTVAFEGLTVIIYSTKDKYDCRLRLPIASIYNNTKYLGFNYFTKAVLKVVNGYFVITECDGSVLDKTNNVFVWDGDVKKTTLASQTTNATGFITNMHYINDGAQQMYTINTNAGFVGRKIIVTSVNTHAITVNLQNGVTLPDGTTTSVVVNAGETKTFISLTSGVINVL